MTESLRALLAREALRMIVETASEDGNATLTVREVVRLSIVARDLQLTCSTDDRDAIEQRVVTASIALYNRNPT